MITQQVKPMNGRLFSSLTLAVSLFCTPVIAKVSVEQAERLGADLTPLGGEKAGNGSTIPNWDGGLPKREMSRGDNPFADDKPLFTIDSNNYQKYAANLTEGQKALFKTFPNSYTLPVYPTRRSASFPEYIYAASKENATGVELSNNGFGFCCAAQGFPFPIPGSGVEILWNHIMRYNTKGYRGYLNHAATAADGDYVVERSYLELSYHYNHPETTLKNLDNQNLWLLTKVVAPANKAGDAHLIQVPIDRIAEITGVWVFNPGLGRVRRIGEVGYDNPAFDGLMTHDQIDMFNGPLDRYSVKLIGKKEVYVPYNSNNLYSPKHKYRDIVTKGHINQSLTRYELHRVWVIEAQVRAGFSHIYKRRTFYLDEDSWLILMQDMYDEHDAFWRTAEAHAVTFQNVPLIVNGVQVHYDLQSRRYVILNMTNEERDDIDYDWYKAKKHYSPRTLKKFATQF
ncbi:MAG: DUF1329 domain-containing protein [Oceanococcus sp.]